MYENVHIYMSGKVFFINFDMDYKSQLMNFASLEIYFHVP